MLPVEVLLIFLDLRHLTDEEQSPSAASQTTNIPPIILVNLIESNDHLGWISFHDVVQFDTYII